MKLSLHAIRYTSIENPTLAHFRHFIRRGGFSSLFTLSPLYICRGLSINQLLFMQNKPNFPKSQMNINPYNTTDYENIANWTIGENKPNSNPIKPNSLKAQMNVKSLITKDYRKNDDFVVRKNKPNSKPISSKAKMSANAFSQKDYENGTAFRPKKTNPNKPNFKPDVSSAEATQGLPRTACAPATTDVFMKSLRPMANFSSISTHLVRLYDTIHSTTPERTRTSNLRFRRPTLYPIELQALQCLSLAIYQLNTRAVKSFLVCPYHNRAPNTRNKHCTHRKYLIFLLSWQVSQHSLLF